MLNATDAEIFQGVSQLIAAYAEALAYSKDDDGNFNVSPYDVLLETNNLPPTEERGIGYLL